MVADHDVSEGGGDNARIRGDGEDNSNNHQPQPTSTTPLLGQDHSPMALTSVGRRGRRTLGTFLLLIVVVLWTSSNFLASTIFADNTYSKPFLVTYLNSGSFIFMLVPFVGSRVHKLWKAGKLRDIRSFQALIREFNNPTLGEETRPILSTNQDEETDGRLPQETGDTNAQEQHVTAATSVSNGKLGFKDTAKLSLEFCIIWHYGFDIYKRYFAGLPRVWTLIFGAAIGVERFTVRKCIGVLTSLFGIFLISRVDISSSSDSNKSSFPNKPPAEIILGNFMAAFSAVLYGVYTTLMKRRVGDESRVDMRIFFGLVGVFASVILWPGFIVLHYTGIEPFTLPPTRFVFLIVLVNAIISFASDICWAFALLLTSPVIVTIGLSLNIPLSLLGQIIIQHKYATGMYWLGATLVFVSFIVVNYEAPT
ncbi:thiamine-repressible mitochondrial transport protein THI74 [Microsporum canis CBS 113480]|uniref:Thiamine-repressible mitochondrial transport protein THI74 n=1 Tax=Arthroderma otae (strain ATCC MYA-4605 / CBS 113480) TaxID=554155 RepID=C5FR22_ARTOC|nr:thiamine-repressible mitochondrial transport protein THI74 [Microsporum canis CBS 113480]EEQ32325.1 thiamine-repressible mitochondrial transport protein THI74 [Microsporum canis CBS 113480]